MLGFEALTLVPFDRRLLQPELLEPAELGWIDRYHQRVRRSLEPHLQGAALDWLLRATEPLDIAGSG